MLKRKHIYFNLLNKLFYIYAILVPDVASFYCQFRAKCARKDDSVTLPHNVMAGDNTVSFPDSISLPVNSENGPTETKPETSRQQGPETSRQQGQQGLPNTCCQDCLCRRNCVGKLESCCFPELLNIIVNESTETCTYAQSPIPHVEKRHNVLAFYMVDRNPPNGCLDTEFSTQHHGKECGEVNAAYWGSLHPASSVGTGKIYRNIHCAKCHGVSDTKLWQASMVFHEELEYRDDHIKFINTEDKLDSINRRCFNGRIINQCPSSDFFIPETVGMDVKTVASACINGLFSPYIHEHVYSNVFCLICNIDLRNYEYLQDMCGVDDYFGEPFTAILVPPTTTVYQKEKNKLACMKLQYHKVSPSCRPVQCQYGTIINGGECQHIIKIMYNYDFLVNVVFVPSSNISQLQVQLEIEDFYNHLIKTWGKDWAIQKVSVSNDISSNVNTVLVSMMTMYERHGMKVSMNVLLDQIKRNLNNSSYLTHHSGNESVYLKPSSKLGSTAFSRIEIDVLLERINNIHDDYGAITEKLNKSKTYHKVAGPRTLYISEHVIMISEMFYCEQIELHQNEFTVIRYDIMYIKHLDILLYKGHFRYVLGRDGLGPKLQICLNESGFSLDISSLGVRNIIVTLNLAMTVFYTTVCLYLH